MEREGEFARGDSRDPFAGRSLMSSFFGGGFRDDPFFTRPFGSLFGSSMFEPRRDDPVLAPAANRPVIREINSDGEEETDEDAKGKDSIAEKKASDVVNRSDGEKMNDEMRQVKNQSFCYRKVTYGGVNGIYRSSTVSRRAGGDGVVLEESKAADLTTGQAEHRISRGIQNKGHSVTKLLKPDGKVETMQTLYNLNEDELAGFEESWKGTASEQDGKWRSKEELRKHSSVAEAGGRRRDSSTRLNWDKKMSHVAAAVTSGNRDGRTFSSNVGRKKVIRIPIE